MSSKNACFLNWKDELGGGIQHKDFARIFLIFSEIWGIL